MVCIEDPLRPEAGRVIASLRSLGIDEYHAQVLPEDKASYVEELRAQGRHVIMVGAASTIRPRSPRPTCRWL